ncbi:MAG: cephalosporin hydroxylase family protein [Hyphomicrobiales bacterium]
MSDFNAEVLDRLAAAKTNDRLAAARDEFINASIASQYSYNFFWMGCPIIQYPQDIMAVQELVWQVKPDLIIETGIAHGGSLILSASMLALLEYSEAAEKCDVVDTAKPKRHVLGVDIDIRAHNREAIEKHPMFGRIEMLQGSSIDPAMVEQVSARAAQAERVMVFLDSNHTHDHVLEELRAYGPLASAGSYCVVFDTVVENLPVDTYDNRHWGPGDNPMTAVDAYLAETDMFEIDADMDAKLQIGVALRGYLKRVR